MSSRLRVKVSPTVKEMVQGELYWVTTTVTNIGDDPITLAKMDSNSFVTYELQYLGSGGANATDELRTVDDMSIVTISQSFYRSWLSGGYPYAKLPDEVVELASGESISVTEDLSEYAIESLVAGDYALFAQYRYEDSEEISDAASMEVIAPAIQRVSQVFCPMEGIASLIYDHKTEDGKFLLFQSRAQNEVPITSVARRRYEFPAAVDDVAIACHTTEDGQGQWFGWIANGAVGAACGWNHILSVEARLAALEHPLAKFVQPAFQLANQQGVFVTFANAEGHLAVQLARFYEGGVDLSAAIIVGDVYSDRVVAHYAPHDDGDRIYLVWTEPTATGCNVQTRGLKLDGDLVEPAAQLLYESDTPVLCCAVECFSFGDLPSVHLLAGQGTPDSELTYVQVSLDPAETLLTAYPLPAPHVQVNAWAIAPVSYEELGVVAATADSILYANALDEAPWSTVVEDLRAPPTHLGLDLATNEVAWVSWVDADLGMRYAKVGRKGAEEESHSAEGDEDETDSQ